MGESNAPNGISVTKRNSAIQQRNFVEKVKVIRIGYGDGTTETDTGFDLPAAALITDVMIDVKTAEASGGTKTIDFGPLSSESGGDADGYADAVSVAATGLIRIGGVVTVGGTETYFSSNTKGVLLSNFLAGTNTATDVGTYLEKSHVNTNGNSISWTPGSNDFAELKADIIIFYKELI